MIKYPSSTKCHMNYILIACTASGFISTIKLSLSNDIDIKHVIIMKTLLYLFGPTKAAFKPELVMFQICVL